MREFANLPDGVAGHPLLIVLLHLGVWLGVRAVGAH